jgi:dual oxidase
MQRRATCPDASDKENFKNPDKKIACGSRTGKTAFLVFFGQQVVEEILDAQRPGCPPEYFNIKIPKDHEFYTKDREEMPFLRSRWSQQTGHSPGNPRQQVTR